MKILSIYDQYFMVINNIIFLFMVITINKFLFISETINNHKYEIYFINLQII